MLRFFTLVSLFALLTAERCATPADIHQEWLYNTWMHSFEEDTPYYRVYRPEGYAFPLARGREGFVLASDSTFVRYQIAPADGLDALRGVWSLRGDVVEAVYGPAGDTLRMRLVGLTENELRVDTRP